MFKYLLLKPQITNTFSPNGTPTTLKQAWRCTWILSHIYLTRLTTFQKDCMLETFCRCGSIRCFAINAFYFLQFNHWSNINCMAGIQRLQSCNSGIATTSIATIMLQRMLGSLSLYITRIKNIINVTRCRDSRSAKSIETR